MPVCDKLPNCRVGAGQVQTEWRTDTALDHRGLTRTPRLALRGHFGNKMGTGLATSAQCGHNIRRSSQHRNWLETKDSKHHCNVFPIPRVWQSYRTQNPVLARGCGFKSHLRYLIGNELETWSFARSLSGPPTPSTTSAHFSPVAKHGGTLEPKTRCTPAFSFMALTAAAPPF